MSVDLKGKVVLVTGASYGVGRAIAIGLAREGCDLVLAATNELELSETARRVKEAGRRCVVCPTDISDSSAVQRLATTVEKEFGTLDALVNCAFGHIGEDSGASLLDVGYEELQRFAEVSIVGTWFVTKAMASLLTASRGRMVFIVADWGLPQHNVFLGTAQGATDKLGSEAFASAKHAITGLANATDRILGIPTIGVFPGIIASMKPSSSDPDAPEYFDIDDSPELIEKEDAYSGGWAIPLSDVVDSVVLGLKLSSTAKAILLKPSVSQYDGLHVD